MDYFEFIITAPDESRDAITSRLAGLGAAGFSEDGETLTAYFNDRGCVDSIPEELENLRAALAASGLNPDFTYRFGILPDRDWNEVWKKNFSPIDVGERFTVIPSWLNYDTSRIPLIIDPGMVFGTGHHESTRTTLQLIEKLSARTKKETFLDIGTGSGILAIAAARLGFKKVTGIDIDPLCVDAAARNARLNGLDNIAIYECGIDGVSGTFQMIAANLLSEILIGIAGSLAEHLDTGGIAVLSGIMTRQETGVKQAMVSAGLVPQDQITEGQWISLVFIKP
ncbi:MAG: 50S ribosomal protein L11 methyltransferase [Nitrospirae bacterium]|nr:50S ribosomal protein L11 methyltransferase [Nitrospirota bacterium]